MIPGKKKVLIVQTGAVEYVEDAYYERYKDEGLLLIPEEDAPVKTEELPKELMILEEKPKKKARRTKKV